MSDSVVVAIIGVVGTIIGSVVTLLVAKIKANQAAPAATPAGQVVDPSKVLGDLVDIRELRILRALYGEPKGRLLDGYKDAYYRPSLDAAVSKGWVREESGKFYLTVKGADVCWGYVEQLHGSWRPVPPGRR